MTPRQLVADVLGGRMTNVIWSRQYFKVLPLTLMDYQLSAILPAVFYMFRFGHRRGKGHFADTYAPRQVRASKQKRGITVERVVQTLVSGSQANEYFDGFDGDVEQRILGDLVLCYCLQNVHNVEGHDKQIQRAFPVHYHASRLDLPDVVAHLRRIPEMIVALLANQQDGDHIKRTDNSRRTWFPVGTDVASNLLVRPFCQGLVQGNTDDLASDRFDETDVGIDQLLMVRLAGRLRSAPDKLRGEDHKISNQRPIAENQAAVFSDSIRRFVRAYSKSVPRTAFIDMLEACVAVEMTAVFTSVADILFTWIETGVVPDKGRQRPAGIFVDCSSGVDLRLRSLAEDSMDDLMRRVQHLPEILMTLRLLDYASTRRYKKLVEQDIRRRPYATEWINLLGKLLHSREGISARLHERFGEDCEELASRLEDANEGGRDGSISGATETLRNVEARPNPVRRLAAALTPMMGRGVFSQLTNFVDASINVDRPNGLANRRRTSRGSSALGGRKSRNVRSLIFSDAVLEYMAHLCLLKSGNKTGVRSLSVEQFLEDIRERYGFHVDRACPGTSISNARLRLNREALERRLRDLGLLEGVNDAEAMKRLRPRFTPTKAEEQ